MCVEQQKLFGGETDWDLERHISQHNRVLYSTNMSDPDISFFVHVDLEKRLLEMVYKCNG